MGKDATADQARLKAVLGDDTATVALSEETLAP